jgi:hypothetical protein
MMKQPSPAGFPRSLSRGPAQELLRIEPRTFEAQFNRSPFLIKHNLCDHRLFALERLMELSKSLAPESIEYNAGTLDISCDPNETPRTGLSIEETIRRIEECKSWMVLKNVERDMEFGTLLEECLAEVAGYSEGICPGMNHSEAFIFLSSPNSITPYHMDPEHNFLLQIRGNKFLTVFDRGVVTAEELERFHGGAHRNLILKDEFLAKSQEFELRPGEGLHVPVTAPHFVRNGPSVSISFSITFRSPDIERAGLAHKVNGRLRRAGLRPRPVGTNDRADMAKVFVYKALRKTRRLLARTS